ncbi:MAG: hypothetical protein WD512_11435 [Candidatus Paceibacterota bacterium]
MANIFIVANEHQVQQVDYVINNLVEEDINILLCENSIKNSKVINSFLRKIDIEIIYFKKWFFKDLVSFKALHKDFIKKIKFLRNEYKEFKIFSSQYGSDFVLLLFSMLRPTKFYLLDEGTASIKVACLRRKRFSFKKNAQLLIKSVLYRKRLTLPKKVTFITDYDLSIKKEDSVIKMSHELYKNEVDRYLDEVHIIGSSVVEAGIVSERNYLNYLKSIVSNSYTEEIFYFSHKSEKADKLAEIERLGLTIVEYKIPYEFRFNELLNLPTQIYSFISPVVFNIANKYQNIPELYTVKLPEHHILKDRPIYKEILETYSRHSRIDNYIV